MQALLLVAFVLSGGAGLIYESIWSRYLGLFVGHSAYAQVIVLAVFLGGMALGAALVARFTERFRRPLVWYAGIEVAVAAIALAFHAAFGGVAAFAYDAVFPALSGVPLQAAKWTIAALLILPQSILLGTTFPLMSAGAIRLRRMQTGAADGAGSTLSLLYFSNSLGAAAGVLVAGFILVGMAGLPGTLVAAALVNLLAAGIAFIVAGWTSDDAPVETVAAEAPPAHPVITALDPNAVRRALLVVASGTALASFIYEIAWIRMLSLVLGSATHSFELMLSAFILGLALGALWMRKRADSLQNPLRALAIIQWVMGVLALATVPLYLMSFHWTANLIGALSRTDGGYTLFTIARYGLSLIIMLPATFFAGTTLPLITRTLMSAGGGERAIGTVYSVNTLGSIIGAAVAALVLLPTLGLKGTLVAGGALDMALGIYIILAFRSAMPAAQRLLTITGVGGAVVAANVLLTQRFDQGVLTSGVYRYGVAPAAGSRTIVYYKDGRTATVAVRRDGSGGLSLSTNGKPDASLTSDWLRQLAPSEPRRQIGGDQVTQAFLPLVTLAHAPQARLGAVIGFGSGVSSHFLLGSPHIDTLVTVEIEPAMVEASQLFRAANRKVYDDPRSIIAIDDAKSYFASSGRRFDLILSEPSNPWVSGVSGLFTDEFYQRIRGHLSENGVFGQWLHLYEIGDDLVSSVISAVHRNFSDYDIFFTSTVDIIIVATPTARLPEPDWGVLRFPDVSEELTRFRPVSPATFEALRLASRETLAPLVESGIPANSDYYPLLDLAAERARFLRTQATGILGLGIDRFALGPALSGYRTPFGTDTLSPVQVARVEALSLGAALRANAVPPDSGSAYLEWRRARHRYQTLRAQLSGPPPDNWSLWFADVLAVDDDVHRGTAGVADVQFFRDLTAYTERHRAPARVRDALRFLQAVSEWDWAAADSAGERVLETAGEAPGLAVVVDFLRDGLTVAKLKRNDVAGARRVFDALAPYASRPASDMRTRLLEAWIRRAEGPAAADSASRSD